MTSTVMCHGCRGALIVPSDPVVDPVCFKGTKITPKLNAPFLCPECRLDKKKLKAARLDMEEFIGRSQVVEGFEG